MPTPAPPFPTAEAIVTEARMYVNDVAPTAGGNLLADNATYTLANFNAAYRFAQRKLANAGVRALTAYAVLVNLQPVATTDPATFVYLNWQNYSDGVNLYTTPVLPPDMIMPLRCWQRLSGDTASPFIPVGQSNDGLPAVAQSAYFQSWEWRNNQLQFPGALQANDIRMLYQKFYPDIADFGDEVTLPIPQGQAVVAYLIAEHFLRSRGSAVTAQMQAKAEQAMRELIRPTIRQKQRGQHRRRPYRSGALGSGAWYGGDFYNPL